MKIYRYQFNYKKNEAYPNYREYDKTEINAPNEETACYIFSGIDGEFKCPDSDDYDIENIGVAYEYDGDTVEWLVSCNIQKTQCIVKLIPRVIRN